MSSNEETVEIPLADDDTIPNELDKSTKQALPAQPLPRDELEDLEEKARLIAQILELQNTLEDLSQRFDNVKEECTKLRSENRVLNQYIKNLMSTSPLFQPANSKSTVTKELSEEFHDSCW